MKESLLEDIHGFPCWEDDLEAVRKSFLPIAGLYEVDELGEMMFEATLERRRNFRQSLVEQVPTQAVNRDQKSIVVDRLIFAVMRYPSLVAGITVSLGVFVSMTGAYNSDISYQASIAFNDFMVMNGLTSGTMGGIFGGAFKFAISGVPLRRTVFP